MTASNHQFKEATPSHTRQIISKEAIETLEKFSFESHVNVPSVNLAARSLLQKIQELSQSDEKEQSKQIESLRKMLLGVYHNKELPSAFIMDLDFIKLTYNILIELAIKFPVNDIDSNTGLPVDPIFYLPIEKNDQFGTMMGQVFSINSIIDYNKERQARDLSLEEKHQEKFLLNPLTNQPFLPMDMERLIIIAAKNNKNLDFMIDQPSESKISPAELSQAFSLKDIASLANGISKHRTIILNEEFAYTQLDAHACMLLCAQNNETKTFAYLYNSLTQTESRISLFLEALETHITITESGAHAFICLLAIYNEPKTLKKIADLCIAAEIDLNHKYKGGIAAIHMAAQHGSMEAMEILLDPQYKIDINLRNAGGDTAVNIATSHKNNNIVRMLADKGANLMITAYEQWGPLHQAAKDNNTELMKILLDHHAQINQKSGVLTITKTAAHFAAASNSKEATEMLLDADADYSIASREGFLPVHYAAFHESIDVMRVLLQRKDKTFPDSPAEGQEASTAATIAAEKGHVKILELLAESKIDLDKPRIDDGTTPLHRAVLNHHYEATRFLIENYLINHKNIFIKHRAGQSPFVFACAIKDWNIAKLFLNKVSDDEIPQEDKRLMNQFHEELGLPSVASLSNGQLLTRHGSFSHHPPLQHAPSTNTQATEQENRRSRNHKRMCCVLM
jgi:ankyrin repeat protein